MISIYFIDLFTYFNNVVVKVRVPLEPFPTRKDEIIEVKPSLTTI